MRPDTEPNIHAKRIMAGAAVVVVGLIGVHATIWFVVNMQSIALATVAIGMPAIVCYVLGVVALDVNEYLL